MYKENIFLCSRTHFFRERSIKDCYFLKRIEKAMIRSRFREITVSRTLFLLTVFVYANKYYTINKLLLATISSLNRSIWVYYICTKNDRDMVYIKSHDEWYCTKCQDKNYIWNSSMVSEENLYQ